MAEARTVLLARPGPARERLRAGLDQAGVVVVLEADPLEVDAGAILASDARNLVIAVDAEVEDALARFDALLADPRYRILFEEAAVVEARDGWDAARWSRHLAAKLLGHGDVLPEGHEGDAPSANAMPPEANAAFEENARLEEITAFEENAPAETEAPALPEPATEAAHDWTRFQDFEAVNELPAANPPQHAESDYRAALAPLDAEALPVEQAYDRIEDELSRFQGGEPGDRWQDFERPASAALPEIAVAAVTDDAPAPIDPVDWELSDAPLATPAEPSRHQADRLDALESRIAHLSLIEEGEPANAGPSGDSMTAANAGEILTAAEGAVVVLAGLGGPDPLRQLLQHLKNRLSVPLLVQQWLDGGHYDRLVRQIERASGMPVRLATAGQPLLPAHVHVLPMKIGVERSGDALRFTETAERGFADVLSALPAAASGVVVLSGTREEFLEPVQRFQQAGGRVFAQTDEGCYDHAVPGLLITRGAEADSPAGLATRIAARWQPQVSA